MMCFSAKQVDPARQRNDEIEKLIRMDRTKAARQVKILLLGAGESGKSTVLKQMRLIHAGGFSQDERKQWRVVIFNNLVHAFQIVLREMEEHVRQSSAIPSRVMDDDNETVMPEVRPQSFLLADPANQKYIDVITRDPDIGVSQPMPQACLEAFTALWRDAGIQSAIHRGNEYALHDNLTYFCSDLPRLFQDSYTPTDQDILRARLRTTGISETVFDLGKFEYRMFDVGGQRSERRKWITAFDNVQVVLFLVAISGYDQVLVEDRNSNQMNEALKIFNEIVNSRWFEHTSIILFLNKFDLFTEKLISGDSPIVKYFPKYAGASNDIKAGRDFFASEFRKLAPPSKIVYVHFTNATDTDLLKKTMDSVQDTIIQQNLDKLIF